MKSIAQKILVVDDDSEFRSSLTKTLQKAGYEVNSVAGGTQAAELIGHYFYPLILLDLHLPGKSGFELLKQIKDKSPRSKVIIITVNGDFEVYHDLEKIGVFAFLHKPVKRADILTHTRRAFY